MYLIFIISITGCSTKIYLFVIFPVLKITPVVIKNTKFCFFNDSRTFQFFTFKKIFFIFYKILSIHFIFLTLFRNFINLLLNLFNKKLFLNFFYQNTLTIIQIIIFSP